MDYSRDTNMELESDFGNLCRLCMGEDEDMRQIFDGSPVCDNRRPDSIASQILSITELKISLGDGLSNLICPHCHERLQLSYEFRELSRTTDAVLRSRLRESKYRNLDVKAEPDGDVSDGSADYRSSDDDEYDGDLEHESLKYKCQAVLDPSRSALDYEDEAYGSGGRCKDEDFSPEDNLEENNGDRSNIATSSAPLALTLVKQTALKETSVYLVPNDSRQPTDRPTNSASRTCPSSESAATRTFPCPECTKSYSNRKTLTHHMRIHTGQNLHPCTLCKKSFIYPYLLTEHMRFHTGERPHQCTVCSKAFNHKNDFGKHMRTHTKEKPYECSFCKKFFSQKGHLVVHLRSHTGEKPYVCPVCGKSFAYQNSLSLHISNHSESKPFACVFCNKSFPQEKNLTKHVKYHTDKKRYECATCGKAFFYPGDLESHVRTHTGERPYACDACDKTFIQKRQLTQHQAKVHPEET